MASVILTFLIALMLGSLAWLGIGARFRFGPDEGLNNWLNLGAYALLAMPFVFVVVFFLIEAL